MDCPYCNRKLLDNKEFVKDLIKAGRLEVLNEINEILEKMRVQK